MKTRWIGAAALTLAATGCGPEAEFTPPPPVPTSPAAPPTHAGATPTAPAAAPAPAPAAPQPALVELQKHAISAQVAAMNAHDAKKMAEIYRPDAVAVEPSPYGFAEQNARQSAEQMASALFTQFPDFKVAA